MAPRHLGDEAIRLGEPRRQQRRFAGTDRWSARRAATSPVAATAYTPIELAVPPDADRDARARAWNAGAASFLPNWRTRRDELNRAPLGHADWLY